MIARKILIVSADEQLLNELNSELTAANFEVATIAGHDALREKIKQVNPFLLIIDFILDDDNAAALCHQLKSEEATQKLNIIILSDYPDLEKFGGKLGSFSIVQKPIVPTDLISNINAVFNEQSHPHQANE